MNTEAVLKIMT